MPSYDEGNNGPGGWWILDEPELHLNLHTLVPDLAGWRRERMPTLPDKADDEVRAPPFEAISFSLANLWA